MKQALRIGLMLAVLSALVIVGSSGTALAGECMSLGEISTECCSTFYCQ